MPDNYKFVSGGAYTLYGSGITATATSITLTTFTDRYGNLLTMSDFGNIGYLSLEPGTAKFEIVSFTGVTQNADGTATITGVTRGLRFKAPYDADPNLRLAHGGSATVKISNPPQMYDKLVAKDNDETISGDYTFTGRAPSIATETSSDTGRAASIEYVNSVVAAGGVDASNSVKGVSKLSVVPAVPTDPIAAGTNDPRIPTQNENDALAGTSGTAPSQTNKLVDAADVATVATANKIARATATGKLDVSFIPVKFGGTGVDGALTVTSGVTTIDLGGAAVVVKNYTSISITGTGSIAFSNPQANGTTVIFKSQGNVTLTSSATPMINASGIGAAGGAAVTASAGATNGNSGSTGRSILVNCGSGNGGTGNGNTVTSGSSNTFLSLVRSIDLQKYSWVAPGGGGGSGQAFDQDGVTATSGAGGRGGGVFIIECAGAWNFTTAAGISVAGQTGGTASYAGLRGGAAGGGGGGGGVFIGLYNTLTANTGTVTVSGGSGGTSVYNGTGGSTFANTGATGGGSVTGNSASVTGVPSGAVSPSSAGADGASLIASNTQYL